MRYTVQPQAWSEQYPYDDGFAVIDTRDNTQVGWFFNRNRADAAAAQLNADPLDHDGIRETAEDIADRSAQRSGVVIDANGRAAISAAKIVPDIDHDRLQMEADLSRPDRFEME